MYKRFTIILQMLALLTFAGLAGNCGDLEEAIQDAGDQLNEQAQSKCGDGNLDQEVPYRERCDDGNTVNGDGCDQYCDKEDSFCGDGKVDSVTEQCDDGNSDNLVCDASCQWVQTCGNGAQEGTEECDDNNLTNNDGCSSTCAIELNICGNGILENGNGEQCDDGNLAINDGCDATCQWEQTCGNGAIEGTEECDDNNLTNNDGCSSSCAIEYNICGNNIVESANGEECDDGNNANNDGCDAICLWEQTCGNGVLEPGEQCDGGPGCAVDCTTTAFTGYPLATSVSMSGTPSGPNGSFTNGDNITFTISTAGGAVLGDVYVCDVDFINCFGYNDSGAQTGPIFTITLSLSGIIGPAIVSPFLAVSVDSLWDKFTQYWWTENNPNTAGINSSTHYVYFTALWDSVLADYNTSLDYLSDLPLITFTVDATWPPVSTTPLTIDAVMQTINLPIDGFYATFDVTSGSEYTIIWDDSYNGSGTYPDGDAIVSALYADQTSIFSNRDCGFDLECSSYENPTGPVTFTASQTGTVYVQFVPYNSSSIGNIGVEVVSGVPTVEVPATTTLLTVNGGYQIVTLVDGGLYLEFAATAGTSYTISWDDSYDGSGAFLGDAEVDAFNPDMTSIFTARDSGYSATSGEGPYTFTATQTGSIYVFLYPYGNDSFYLGDVGFQVTSP